MAALTLQTNLGVITADIAAGLQKLADKEYIPRLVAFDIIDVMTMRIHERGLASDGAPIGTYSKDYLSLRQRKYERNSDPKVIVSLTRQLENDWSVIATDDGYGIGFKNPINLDKFRWVEENKDRDIGDLTTEEQNIVNDIIERLVDDALK